MVNRCNPFRGEKPSQFSVRQNIGTKSSSDPIKTDVTADRPHPKNQDRREKLNRFEIGKVASGNNDDIFWKGKPHTAEEKSEEESNVVKVG